MVLRAGFTVYVNVSVYIGIMYLHIDVRVYKYHMNTTQDEAHVRFNYPISERIRTRYQMKRDTSTEFFNV